MNLLPCIEKVLIINYMAQLRIYFFLNNFLCVFDKCGLFTLAIFSNSVSGFLLEGRGWEVEGRKIIYKESRVILKSRGSYIMVGDFIHSGW